MAAFKTLADRPSGMSVVVVPADPPREGLVLPHLTETSPLSAAEAADLYAATLKDVATAGATSGGDLLVNYRPDDLLPADHRAEESADVRAGESADVRAGESAEAEVRAAVRTALGDLDDVRFEPQVGSSYEARIGNTVTHLLEAEAAGAVLVVDPTAALAGRTVIDSAGMKVRRSEVVLGPAPGGRVHLAGFAEPVDFEGAYATPALETLTARAGEAGLAVDFVEHSPVVETGADLATLVATVRARAAAGRIVPEHTLAAVEDLGLRVVEEDGQPTVRTDNS